MMDVSTSEAAPLVQRTGRKSRGSRIAFAFLLLVALLAVVSFGVVLALYLSASHNPSQRFTLAEVQNRSFLVGEGGVPRSWFHDLALQERLGDPFNVYAEIGVGGTAKLEVMKSLPLNPIAQDTKNGVPRFNPPYPFIYGAFPQTWEDPRHLSFGMGGDNDPLDCVVLGSSLASTGSVLQVKVVGAYAMIDSGEADWKIVAVDWFDPHAAEIVDGPSLERFYPGALNAVFVYLSSYKSPPPQFANGGALLGPAEAEQVVRELHELWRALDAQSAALYGINLTNTQLHNAFTISAEAARNIVLHP
jgi:inorganic pyrophosphatase